MNKKRGDLPKKKRTKSAEEIQNENEFLKMSLMAEFGGEFFGDSQIPSDIENAFLKQIQRFHRKQVDAKPTVIYDLLGRPEYNHVNDLSEREIKRGLSKFMKMLHRKKISVFSIAGISDREMYRFITEDVFKSEVQLIKAPNVVMNIIYEEQYPNDEADVKMLCSDIITFIYDDRFSFITDVFASDFKDNLGLMMEPEDLIEKIEEFKAGFNKMELLEEDYVKFKFSQERDAALVSVNVEYKTQAHKGNRYKKHETKVDFHLVKEKDDMLWYVSQIHCEELFGGSL
jgi:hypothetical protein